MAQWTELRAIVDLHQSEHNVMMIFTSLRSWCAVREDRLVHTSPKEIAGQIEISYGSIYREGVSSALTATVFRKDLIENAIGDCD